LFSISTDSIMPQSALASLFNDWTGSRMVIPSLEALSPNWPMRKNPWLEHIGADFTSWANM
jgi:hypothetical protein